jgi:DNA-binding NarL/FixJ family response regulator
MIEPITRHNLLSQPTSFIGREGEIADWPSIGVSTVKKHINHIYSQLNIQNRTQAAARVREGRII